MFDLESALLDDVRWQLERSRAEFAGRPDLEREQLWLLALEREQIVAVAYREEAVAGRVDTLEVSDELRSLIRQTLVWIWKDEALHAEYLRGLLLKRGGFTASMVVYGRQLQGALSGWVSSTEHHLNARSAPLRTGTARALVTVAGLLGRIPPALRRELRYQTFQRYCDLNVALEATAELAYRRLVELATTDQERDTFERIRSDEERHKTAFRVLSSALDARDRLRAGESVEQMRRALSAISPWFCPAVQRPVPGGQGRRAFGRSGTVVVRGGDDDHDKLTTLRTCLDRAGLAELACHARTAAVRLSFMLGYDRRDRSNVNDPEIVEALAMYLHDHGVEDVAMLEAPTVYDHSFANRSVAHVATYLGFRSPAYRVVDIRQDLRPFTFERGFVQQAISGTWLDADLRIVMPKLRTDPTEFAHLSLSTLEGTTGTIADTIYAERQVDFRSATMMLLDVAPPDFAIVDGWAPVADGPFGVMGCNHPADVRCLYAGRDALAVDESVLADLGVRDARRAPIVRRAHHWFGIDQLDVQVDGARPPLALKLRGAHASAPLRVLGTVSYPVYVYLSHRGELFVPAMDTAAFPPAPRPGFALRAVRWGAQRAFGLRPPSQN